MNTKILLLALLTFYKVAILAQHCLNNVSTNPSSPFNPTVPIFAFPSNAPNQLFQTEPGIFEPIIQVFANETIDNYGKLFLNRFNWFTQEVAMSGIPLSDMVYQNNMSSPWTDGVNSGLPFTMFSSLMGNPGINEYSDLDPVHQNGWELISVNLGRFANDLVTLHEFGFNNTFYRFPYFILYNRHTGVLRLFGNCHELFPEIPAFNAIKITMKHRENSLANGVLRLTSGLDKALDKNTDILASTVVTVQPSTLKRWFVADFQMAFDPCVCELNSQFFFEFDGITTSTVNLSGIGNEAETQIINNQQIYQLQELFINFQNGNLEGQSGLLMYNNMIDALIRYRKLLLKYNNTVNQVNSNKYFAAILQYGIAVLTYGIGNIPLNQGSGTGSGTGSTGQEVSIVDAILTILNSKPELEADDSTPAQPKLKDEAFFKELNKTIQKLGDIFTGNLFSTEKPTKPVPATVRTSEFYINGTITNNDKRETAATYFPGVVGGTQVSSQLNTFSTNAGPLLYPIYNEPLGIFAFLETPKIKVTTAQDAPMFFHNEDHDVYTAFGQVGTRPYIYTASKNSTIQVKLEEPIKYALNPKLEFSDLKVEYSIMLEFDTPKTGPSGLASNPMPNNAGWTQVNVNFKDYLFYDIHPLSANMFSTAVDLSVGGTLPPEPSRISTIPVPLSDGGIDMIGSVKLNQRYAIPWNLIPDPVYIPITYPYDFAENGWLWDNEFMNLVFDQHFKLEPKIFVKVIISGTLNETLVSGAPAEYSYVFTVPLEKDVDFEFETNEYINEYAIAGSEFDMGEESKSFGDTHFDGSPVSGCAFWGFENTYRCRAWNNIDIMGEITIDTPYKVLFQAGNSIVEHPGAILPPESVREIVPFLDFSEPIISQTAEEVEYFCTQGNYAAHNLAPISDDIIVEEDEEELPEFDFIIFPNPTSTFSTLNFELFTHSNVSVSLMDLSGNILDRFELLENAIGMQRVPMNLSELAAGVYFVQVIVNEQSHVKRIIKQ
jgi:hypothetical protein